jgi:hypothetical protein
LRFDGEVDIVPSESDQAVSWVGIEFVLGLEEPVVGEEHPVAGEEEVWLMFVDPLAERHGGASVRHDCVVGDW